MRRTSLSLAAVLVVLSTLPYACGTPAQPPTPTLPPPATPTSTLTPLPPPTLTPTATNTPEPTPVPGVEVVPLASLADGIPWLAYDESKKPMSVYYGFNVEKPPFGDLLVRQAFAAAIDREKIAEKALGYYFREAKPATTLTHPEVLTRNLYNEVGIPFDPARAKELLKKAGYFSVSDFPSTTLLVSTRGRGAPGAYYQMAKDIADMWEANLGIKVKIEVVEIKDYPARFASDDPPGIYQLGWVADYIDPDNFLKALFHSGNEINRGHFSNAEFDRLVDEAARLTDPEKRLLLYIRAEQILTEEETGVIPLYHSYVPVPYVY